MWERLFRVLGDFLRARKSAFAVLDCDSSSEKRWSVRGKLFYASPTDGSFPFWKKIGNLPFSYASSGDDEDVVVRCVSISFPPFSLASFEVYVSTKLSWCDAASISKYLESPPHWYWVNKLHIKLHLVADSLLDDLLCIVSGASDPTTKHSLPMILLRQTITWCRIAHSTCAHGSMMRDKKIMHERWRWFW
jgi:hypothetical protein